MPFKEKKKPLFFTLDPVAALAYNRTDRYRKKKYNDDDDKNNKCKIYNKLV